MIITVTSSTITSVAAMGLTAAVSIAAIVSLILFLVTKELASASGSNTSSRIARFFNIGILPLVMAFTVIIAVKIAGVLA